MLILLQCLALPLISLEIFVSHLTLTRSLHSWDQTQFPYLQNEVFGPDIKSFSLFYGSQNVVLTLWVNQLFL